MISLDLLLAFGSAEIVQFFWLLLLMDVPRYLVAAATLAVISSREPASNGISLGRTSGLIACHNEAATIRACVMSLRANGIAEIVVVNDGSTDSTYEVATALDVIVVDLPERIGKPNALNAGLPFCTGELVLATDADTRFTPGSVARAARYLAPGVGGVGFELAVRNVDASLITRHQGIEYAIAFTAGRRIADAFGILPNVSGAAGLFRREALVAVGGWDCEVAEDAALAVKLRCSGWRLRYAPGAVAETVVPETVVDLLLQRLRWDTGIVTIWWFKHRAMLTLRFGWANLFTALDVLVFGALMPLVLLGYVTWLWMRIGSAVLILLGAVMIVLAVIDVLILLLVRTPLRLFPYVPFFLVTETVIMRPLRVIALIGELVFSLSRYDPYMPGGQRSRLT